MSEAGAQGDGVVRRAVVSADELFRYRLDRVWGDGPPLVFVMLNPSTADGTEDDPTVRRCMGYARREGCSSLVVVNLFAWRATKPADLWAAMAEHERPGAKAHPHPSGGEVAERIMLGAFLEARDAAGGRVVAGWGTPKGGWLSTTRHRDRARWAVGQAQRVGVPLWCLGRTKDGSPRHPLYVRRDAELVRLG